MSDGIRVDSRELERALDRVAEDTAAMPETWARVAEELLPGVRQRTPIRSGAMRDSWTGSGEPGRAVISSELPYAGVIEAVNAPVADTLGASERLIVETLEDEIARSARRAGFEVRR